MTEQESRKLKRAAELWEERRGAHWKMMRAAWERFNELVAEHEAQGFNGRNPFERANAGISPQCSAIQNWTDHENGIE